MDNEVVITDIDFMVELALETGIPLHKIKRFTAAQVNRYRAKLSEGYSLSMRGIVNITPNEEGGFKATTAQNIKRPDEVYTGGEGA